MSDFGRMLDEFRFWQQVVQDSRRTLLVAPDLESRAIEMVKAQGLAHIVTVKANPYLPEGKVYLVDEQAIEADMAQAMQHYRPTFG